LQEFEFRKFGRLMNQFHKSPYFVFVPGASFLFKWGGGWLDKKIMLHAVAYTPPKILQGQEIGSVSIQGLRFNKIPISHYMLVSDETINVLLDDTRRYDANQSNIYVYAVDPSNNQVTLPSMPLTSEDQRGEYGKAIQVAQIAKTSEQKIIHLKNKLQAEKDAIHQQYLDADNSFSAAKAEATVLKDTNQKLNQNVIDLEQRERLVGHKLTMAELESKSLREENEQLQEFLGKKDTALSKLMKTQDKIMADLDLLSKSTFSEEKFRAEVEQIKDEFAQIVKKHIQKQSDVEEIPLDEAIEEPPKPEKSEKKSETPAQEA